VTKVLGEHEVSIRDMTEAEVERGFLKVKEVDLLQLWRPRTLHERLSEYNATIILLLYSV